MADTIQIFSKFTSQNGIKSGSLFYILYSINKEHWPPLVTTSLGQAVRSGLDYFALKEHCAWLDAVPFFPIFETIHILQFEGAFNR